MARYVVIGTSPFVEATVAVGPMTVEFNASRAADDLEQLGYVAEVCQLSTMAELREAGPVVNDEGADE